MPNEMVVVARFLHVHEAELAKSFLASPGLRAEVLDKHIASINWFYSNVIGGVRLMVAEEDSERAKKELRSVNHGLKVYDRDDEVPNKREKLSSFVTLVYFLIAGALTFLSYWFGK